MSNPLHGREGLTILEALQDDINSLLKAYVEEVRQTAKERIILNNKIEHLKSELTEMANKNDTNN